MSGMYDDDKKRLTKHGNTSLSTLTIFPLQLGSVSEKSESHDYIRIRLISKNLRSSTKNTLLFLSYVTYDTKRP